MDEFEKKFTQTVSAVKASDELKKSTLAALRARAAAAGEWAEEERPADEAVPAWAKADEVIAEPRVEAVVLQVEAAAPADETIAASHKPTYIAGKKRAKFVTRYLVAAIAACLCFVVVGFGAFSFYQTPKTFISVDVNPSLELSVNAFGRVVSATAYNDDGQSVLDQVNVTGEDYLEALKELIYSGALQSYLSDQADLTLTLASANGQEADAEQEAAVSQLLEEAKAAGLAAATMVEESTCEVMEEAHSHGCSLGKYAAYLELSSHDSSVTLEDCESMTMHEIHSCIDECEHGEDDEGEESESHEEHESSHHEKGHGHDD